MFGQSNFIHTNNNGMGLFANPYISSDTINITQSNSTYQEDQRRRMKHTYH